MHPRIPPRLTKRMGTRPKTFGLTAHNLDNRLALHRQAVVTGHTVPGSVEFDPSVGKAPAAIEELALVLPFFVIGSGYHADRSVHLDPKIFRDQKVIVIGLVLGERHVLFLGLQRAIGLGNDKIVGQNEIKRARIVLQFSLVPGIFESENLAFISFVEWFLRNARRGGS